MEGDPLLGSSKIPDITAFRARAYAAGLDDVTFNRRVTTDYMAVARLLEPIVDAGGAGERAVLPNWFALAAHASNAAGESIALSSVLLKLADQARHGFTLPPDATFQAVGLSGWVKEAAKLMSGGMQLRGVPAEAATLLAAVSISNVYALGDVRAMATTAVRAAKLYAQSPGATQLDKVESLLRTLHDMMASGNQALHGDLGESAESYLNWRAAQREAPSPQSVVENFSWAGSTPDQAQAVCALAQAHLFDSPMLSDFSSVAPDAQHSGQLLVAAYALYEEAGQTADLTRKNQLVSMANSCFAFREQRDELLNVFTPPVTFPGEVSRHALMATLTPSMRLDFGPVQWSFLDYAKAASLPDLDSNPLTSAVTSYNWADFPTRWAAILSAFQMTYASPGAAWQFPDVERPSF